MTDEFMSDRETHWIEVYKSNSPAFGYNLTKGGDGAPGRKVSAVTKAKISDANKGRKHTDEARANMSCAKQNMSAATKAKMSESRKGKNNHFFGLQCPSGATVLCVSAFSLCLCTHERY